MRFCLIKNDPWKAPGALGAVGPGLGRRIRAPIKKKKKKNGPWGNFQNMKLVWTH